MRRRRILVAVAAGTALLVVALVFTAAPSIAAGGLLHPTRVALYRTTPQGCVDRDFAGDDVTLRGWSCTARGQRRGSVVYLHGVADNRSSAVGVIDWFTQRGFDVVAYDSRAHGQSDGSVCTYGFYEKRDLKRVIDSLAPEPVLLMGNSLGAAVAIQAAAGDERVAGVIAAEAFSDLQTIVTERVPRILPRHLITRAFEVAEERGHFDVAGVSPVAAAASLRMPVLLIHGADDVNTRPEHSRRILAALSGPKQLLLVPHAGHNESLNSHSVWIEIERWLSAVVPNPVNLSTSEHKPSEPPELPEPMERPL
jgi:pimeloyl-ACP methyl ester carboxylesterase